MQPARLRKPASSRTPLFSSRYRAYGISSSFAKPARRTISPSASRWSSMINRATTPIMSTMITSPSSGIAGYLKSQPSSKSTTPSSSFSLEYQNKHIKRLHCFQCSLLFFSCSHSAATCAEPSEPCRPCAATCLPSRRLMPRPWPSGGYRLPLQPCRRGFWP